MMWVVDASVAVRWFLDEEYHPAAEEVLAEMVKNPTRFAVPELFSFEVFSVLCRVHPSGPDVFLEGVLPILNSGILRQPMTENLVRETMLFLERGLTGYDACYAALARELDGLWLTFDGKAHGRLKGEKISHDLSHGLPEQWVLP